MLIVSAFSLLMCAPKTSFSIEDNLIIFFFRFKNVFAPFNTLLSATMEPLGIGEIFNVDTLISISVPHIFEKIFSLLDYKSYKKCSAVSTAWNKLFSSECFQKLKKDLFHEDIEKEVKHALRMGNTAKIRKLVSSGLADVMHVYGNLGTPLHIAAKRGDRGLVQYILGKGAEINAQDTSASTALCEAAEKGHLNVVRFLLDRGACPDTGYVTPMHRAADNGHTEVLQLLINELADVNVQIPRSGFTPLHVAAIEGHKDAVNLLLDSGADHSMIAHNGQTPIKMAYYFGRKCSKDIIEILKHHIAMLQQYDYE